MGPETLFHEFALLLAVAAAMGLVAHWLRQPLIVAFITVGILVGPAGLRWISMGGEIELLSKVGISLLLFTVGLRLDLNVIRRMGPVSLATGLGQVAFTSIVGYAICRVFGFAHIESIYIAVALTFSSTIIIVKLLSDKREIDSLHGRIAVGFLIVQDLVVVLVMILLTAAGGGTAGENWFASVISVGAKGFGMLLLVLGVMRFVMPRMGHRIARSPELLTTLGICWAITLSGISDWLGFSKEVGAFLAGVSMASMPYRDALGARLVGLRDFLLLFFFVELGANLQLSEIGAQTLPSLALSAFVLIGNPLIVMIIMGFMGYRKRTGFLAGLTVAQISEFSLMLGALGVALGHINASVLGVITIVGLITITTSTYMILYSHQLYERIAPALEAFERKNAYRETAMEADPDDANVFDVIVIGLGRFGSRIAEDLNRRGLRVLGVDFDPDIVKTARASGRPVVYGDADDPEFAQTLPIANACVVISSIPPLSVNLSLIHSLKTFEYAGIIAATAHNDADAAKLRQAGCSLVLSPFNDAASRASEELAQMCKVASVVSDV